MIVEYNIIQALNKEDNLQTSRMSERYSLWIDDQTEYRKVSLQHCGNNIQVQVIRISVSRSMVVLFKVLYVYFIWIYISKRILFFWKTNHKIYFSYFIVQWEYIERFLLLKVFFFAVVSFVLMSNLKKATWIYIFCPLWFIG